MNTELEDSINGMIDERRNKVRGERFLMHLK